MLRFQTLFAVWSMIVNSVAVDQENAPSSYGSLHYFLFPNFTVNVKESGISLYIVTLASKTCTVSINYGDTNLVKGTLQSTEPFNYQMELKNIHGASPTQSQVINPFKVLSDKTCPTALTVYVMANKKSMASFQSVPVSSWGRKYVVMTLNHNPSVQIFTVENQQIWINMQCSKPCHKFFSPKLKAFTNGSNIISSEQAFTISFCFQDYHGSLSGTKIHGEKPLGVISGNCLAKTQIENCDTPGKFHDAATDGDLATEMLMPYQNFGMEFIAITTSKPGMRDTSGENQLYALMPSTFIILDMKKKTRNVTMRDAGGIYSYSMTKAEFPHKITSNKPIQVLYIQRSPCAKNPAGTSHDLGDVAVTLLLPNDMFFHIYSWRYNILQFNYVIIVKQKSTDVFSGAGDNVKQLITLWYDASTNWETGDIESNKFTSAYSTSDHTFGCYIFGYGDKVSYMHVAANLYNYECVKQAESQRKPSDNIDNDCDGEIDEEIDDEQDDDHDFEIDEDVKSKFYGFWTEWTAWDCNKPCVGSKGVDRIRFCKRIDSAKGQYCTGSNEERKECSKCTIDKDSCPSRHWGASCENSCANCQENCSRTEGVCRKCVAGFKNPHQACTEACDHFMFGENCLSSCMQKCHSDCDRVDGTCHKNSKVYYWFLLILVVPIAAILYILVKRSREKDDSPSTSATSSKVNTSKTTVTLTTTIMTLKTNSNVDSAVTSNS
ncbi:multiple epidermal growth factor-like domains protein 10 [Biomphalaria pfeifferi]|uniref:Multiple epidermal growth factor-like domains protein 10 n=1 Tax=Biomphalaria pfeifferi TaxID=112525 RepID=A0AAD8BWA1_BIOPF|nr:multiple epidermal growth factor-like domains protein 10 [Biomphalaria pfeifferi]